MQSVLKRRRQIPITIVGLIPLRFRLADHKIKRRNDLSRSRPRMCYPTQLRPLLWSLCSSKQRRVKKKKKIERAEEAQG